MKWYSIVGVCLFAAALSACVDNGFAARMERKCAEKNRRELPRMVEKETRLDSMAFCRESRTLVHFYSLCGSLDVDSLYTPEIVEIHRMGIIDEIEGSVGYREEKREGVNFSCVYKSASRGDVLFECVIASGEYRDGGHRSLK